MGFCWQVSPKASKFSFQILAHIYNFCSTSISWFIIITYHSKSLLIKSDIWIHNQSIYLEVPVPLTTMWAPVTRWNMSVSRAVWTFSVASVTALWPPPANLKPMLQTLIHISCWYTTETTFKLIFENVSKEKLLKISWRPSLTYIFYGLGILLKCPNG
jgi:hypothetical protein